MTESLERALRATGYVRDEAYGTMEAEGLFRDYDAGSLRLEPAFSSRAGLEAVAVYQATSGPMILIKDSGDRPPRAEDCAEWHERAWNLGIAPLLWIVTPTDVRVYDAFSGIGGDEGRAALGTYRLNAASELEELDAFCGRLAMDTGAFWSSPLAANISRSKRVDRILLEEIAALEEKLCTLEGAKDAPTPQVREHGQSLIACILFAAYLLDRGIANSLMPTDLPRDLSKILASKSLTTALFGWLHDTFDGDVFPRGMGEGVTDVQLAQLLKFATGESMAPRSLGQLMLFRFRFDSIPIELISSVYEEFARRSAGEAAREQGLHYTPVELVHMALDPIFEGLGSDARILDPTCGSGLFLVQSLRRLIFARYGQVSPTRKEVRDVLYQQIFGADINPSALRIAAFSLYLSVMELEAKDDDDSTIKFERLIGRNLVHADFLSTSSNWARAGLKFDAIVGNPPWTHVSGRKPDRSKLAQARRTADQEFLSTALDLAGRTGRVAMYLKATPFYSRDDHAAKARSELLSKADRMALVDLSNLRSDGLFPGVQAPAMLFCANCKNLPPEGEILLGTVPWTPDFERSGAIAWSSADAKVVPLESVLRSKSSLKAVMRGTFRDARLMEKLEGPGYVSLAQLLDDSGGVIRGQGWQHKGKKPRPIDPQIALLPTLKAEDFTAGWIDTSLLPTFADRGIGTLHRQRSVEIYRAPLLLCPKSAHKLAFEAGRYGAALSETDVAFSEGLYGISFKNGDAGLAAILCAVLNSPVASFQFLFGSGGLGTERPTIGPTDFLQVRVPRIEPSVELANRAQEVIVAAKTGDLGPMDQFAYRLFGLSTTEGNLVTDSVRRGQSAFLDTEDARKKDIMTPTSASLASYATSVCRTMNGYLKFAGRRHVVAEIASSHKASRDPLDCFLAVRFGMQDGDPVRGVPQDMAQADTEELFEDLRGRLLGTSLPYLRERRSLRIYSAEHVTVVKPAQIRYWSVAAGMQDGDVILADHWMQGAT